MLERIVRERHLEHSRAVGGEPDGLPADGRVQSSSDRIRPTAEESPLAQLATSRCERGA